MFCRLAACLLAVAFLAPPLAGAADPSSQALVALAARYVTAFIDQFSNVVAEEHYVQEWKTSTGITLLKRESTSDFLLTRVSESNLWQAFRDVFEVNGTPIRDRQDRLTKLFMQPRAQAVDQAATIAAESARYNISNVQRTVNQPLFVLTFLQPEHQTHFAYSVDRADRTHGEEVWVVEFKEKARPTLIRGTGDKDLPAEGRFWIDSTNGRIVRTELQLEDRLQSARITTDFQGDDRFGIEVPVLMEEQYTVKGNAGKVTARATYTRFREFEVRTDERLR